MKKSGLLSEVRAFRYLIDTEIPGAIFFNDTYPDQGLAAGSELRRYHLQARISNFGRGYKIMTKLEVLQIASKWVRSEWQRLGVAGYEITLPK